MYAGIFDQNYDFFLEEFTNIDETNITTHNPSWEYIRAFSNDPSLTSGIKISNNQGVISFDNLGAVIDFGFSDVIIEHDWITAANELNRGHIVCRYDSDGNGIWLNYRVPNQDIQLLRIVNDTNQTILVNNSFNWIAGNTYKIKLICQNNQFWAYVDNVEIFTVTDSTFSNKTKHGFMRAVGSDFTAIDNFKITKN